MLRKRFSFSLSSLIPNPFQDQESKSTQLRLNFPLAFISHAHPPSAFCFYPFLTHFFNPSLCYYICENESEREGNERKKKRGKNKERDMRVGDQEEEDEMLRE
jgi:hypothetical protein